MVAPLFEPEAQLSPGQQSLEAEHRCPDPEQRILRGLA